MPLAVVKSKKDQLELYTSIFLLSGSLLLLRQHVLDTTGSQIAILREIDILSGEVTMSKLSYLPMKKVLL